MNKYFNCRHVEANKLEGDWIVLMDHFVARHFDLVVWTYSLEVECLSFSNPGSICNAQRIFNAGGIARYTGLMLFYINTR